MPKDKDIEKALRDMGKEKVDYPRDLKSATRAEFTTNVRMANKKGPGCPLLASIFLLTITMFLIGGYTIGSTVVAFAQFFMWMVSNSL